MLICCVFLLIAFYHFRDWWLLSIVWWLLHHTWCDMSLLFGNAWIYLPTSINMLFFSEIEMRSWHNAILEVRILQLHIVIGYMMLHSDHILAKFLTKDWKFNSVKLICKCENLQRSAKLVATCSCRPKTAWTAENVWTRRHQLEEH